MTYQVKSQSPNGQSASPAGPRSSFLPPGLGLLIAVSMLSPPLMAGPPQNGEIDKRESCETNLTCMKATRVASNQRFSQGPDLSKWEAMAPAPGSSLLKVGARQIPASVLDPESQMEFVLVPGICYRTGGADELPNQVCVDPYYIGAYEVTLGQYDRFARETGRALPDDEGWGRENRPAINVSVYDALNFAKWLSRKTGVHHRLPTEVEWEHAARAGSDTRFPWGEELGGNRANCDGCGSQWDDEQTAPVGSFEANAWGLYDVVGNVGEWTCSMRDPDPMHSFERCDSIYETRRRVYRNGAWSDDEERLGVAFRDWNVGMRRTDDVGFRLVRECGECKIDRPQHLQGSIAQQKPE